MEPIEYQRLSDAEDVLWWYRALHSFVAAELDRHVPGPEREGVRLLDAGCGTGGLLEKLGGRLPHWHVFGLDRSSEATHRARAKSGAPVVQGSVNALPFADESLDVILGMDLLYHVGVDQGRALEEVRRCLKPGGLALFNLPAYEWLRSAHDQKVHTRRRYTRSAVRRMLEAARLGAHGVFYRNSFLFPIMMVHRLTVGRLRTTSDMEPVPPWLNRLLLSVIRFEAWLSGLGLNLPFGGSVWVRAMKA